MAGVLVLLIRAGTSYGLPAISSQSIVAPARPTASISYVKPRKTCNNSSHTATITPNVPFRRCPSLPIGDDPHRRPPRLFARADHGGLGGMGRVARPQSHLSHAVGTHLARRFARPRPFPPPAAPAGARMARRRGLPPVLLPPRTSPPGRRHQPQQRAPRRRPGGLGRLLDGPAACRPGPDERRVARGPAV